MFVYMLSPLDFWSGWQRPEDVFKVVCDDDSGSQHDPRDWYPLWETVKDGARVLGWEGDIRCGPYVTVLPDEGGDISPVVVAWKQDNNGSTFVASPHELPWFRGETCAYLSEVGVWHHIVWPSQ